MTVERKLVELDSIDLTRGVKLRQLEKKTHWLDRKESDVAA
jgi:hypothetical protein